MDSVALADLGIGGANFMLGILQVRIAGGESITPAIWQDAITEAVAFEARGARDAQR